MLNVPGIDHSGTSELTQWESLAKGKRGTVILLLSIVLHLIAFMAWPNRGRADAEADIGKTNTFALFLTTPQLPTPAPAVRMPARLIPTGPGRPTHPPALDSPTLQVAHPTQSGAPVVIDPIHTEPGPSAVQDLAGIAKDNAGKTDRELRNTGPRLAHSAPVYQGTKLEKGIAAAYVDRSPPKHEELVLDDGRRVTRIGNQCYGKDSPLYTRGIDQIKHGALTYARQCWQLGVGGK